MRSESAMIEALEASHPRASLAEKLQLFGQFVGSWDVVGTSYRPDGSQETVQGEWHFGWVLEGRAIQDVWIAPKRSLRAGNGRGWRVWSNTPILRSQDRCMEVDLDWACKRLGPPLHCPANQ
jgi:hypothetical protein